MDGFNTKFIKMIEDMKKGELFSNDLDNYIKEHSDKNIFNKCILSLMEHKDEYVKIYSSKYCFEYNINNKKAYDNARYILRNSKDNTCRIEAKYIYDRYKRRHLTKIAKVLMKRKLKNS